MNELLDRLQGALGDAYRIESELPGGGMSRLFVATEASLNRRVVVKVLPPEFASDVSAARFKQEVELAARLQHPHILPVLAAGARDNLLYYVMPYVKGESLRHWMQREGQLPVADAQRVLFEIADALTAAHAAGIVHRDIKPENILLEGRHAVLADFGIARAIAQSRTGTSMTSTGTSMGTPGYMSPEQLAGERVDGSADVYALAVVGYEMLSGKPPFSGGTAQALLTAHLIATPMPLHELRPDVPRLVSAAIARALAKDPSQRFDSVAGFAEAIDPMKGTTGQRPVAARLSKRPVMRVIVLLVALGAAASLFMMWRRGRLSDDTVAAIAVLADSGRLDSIAALLGDAAPDDGRLAASAQAFVGRLRLDLTRPDVDATLTRATPFESFPGRAPVWRGRGDGDEMPLVAGEYVLRVALGSADTLVTLVEVPPGGVVVREVTLPPADSTASHMRVVTAGPSPTGDSVAAFLLDRAEVSNAEYLRFVNAGGYRTESFWPATMLVDGIERPRGEALARFVDRSGLPGPRYWSSGRPADGQGDHPVVGVTWYEAAAYAAWAGKALPTAAQWWRAALGDGGAIYPWGGDAASVTHRANLDGRGTRPRGSMPLGASPFGGEDMAGNAREWLADSTANAARRIVVGGSWQDPSYMFERSHTESFSPGFFNEAIGFRLVRPMPRP